MLIVTTKFSKRKAVLTVIGVGLVMAALILLAGRTTEETTELPQLTGNAQRVEYLRSPTTSSRRSRASTWRPAPASRWRGLRTR